MRCLWFCSNFGQPVYWRQGYVPVLLENLRGMSCSGTCWPLCGAWFQCRCGRLLNVLLSINVPWSQEFSGVLRFWT